MPAPHLDTVCFAKLSSSPSKENHGTVTGTDIHTGDGVTIRSKSSTKVWAGRVTSHISGNSWNAVVVRAREDDRATETVGVTVTNDQGESNEVRHESDVP
jgi:hypothetical protein